jgi:hypothetical protein
MPEISIILDHIELGKTKIAINNDKTFAEMASKYCKQKGISKKIIPNLKFIFNGNEIPSSSVEKIEKLSIRNSSVIKVTTEKENNMQRGRDDWRDGIIQGRGHFSFVSEEDKNFIFKSLREKVSKAIKNKLYSATEDGDTAQSFHQRCDNKGALFYLIKTATDAVFGIYNSESITSENVTRTISTQMVVCPYKNFAELSNKTTATHHCFADQGPRFHCMQINAPFLSSNCVDITGCFDFTLPSYPSGSSSTYRIKEFEVYSLEQIN